MGGIVQADTNAMIKTHHPKSGDKKCLTITVIHTKICLGTITTIMSKEKAHGPSSCRYQTYS